MPQKFIYMNFKVLRMCCKSVLFAILTFCCISFAAYSQSDSTSYSINLDSIFIKATKIKTPWLKSANSVYNINTQHKGQLAQNSLQETLIQSPSIFAMNANNKAQDLRISVRGH